MGWRKHASHLRPYLVVNQNRYDIYKSVFWVNKHITVGMCETVCVRAFMCMCVCLCVCMCIKHRNSVVNPPYPLRAPREKNMGQPVTSLTWFTHLMGHHQEWLVAFGKKVLESSMCQIILHMKKSKGWMDLFLPVEKDSIFFSVPKWHLAWEIEMCLYLPSLFLYHVWKVTPALQVEFTDLFVLGYRTPYFAVLCLMLSPLPRWCPSGEWLTTL